MLDLEKLNDVSQETIWAASMIGFVYMTGMALTIGIILLAVLL